MLSIVVHYFRNAPCVLNLISTFLLENRTQKKTILNRSASTKPGKWSVMYLCTKGMGFVSFNYFSIALCSDSVIFFLFFILLLSKQNNGNAYVFVRKKKSDESCWCVSYYSDKGIMSSVVCKHYISE